MTHVNDKVCNCEFCTMIDCLWGDPLLSAWESKFINNVARSGWFYEYTIRQKAKIQSIFKKMLHLRGIKQNVA